MALEVQTMTSAVAYNQDPDLIRRMYAKNCTDDEFTLFLTVCKNTGLDPTRNQIYAIKRMGKNPKMTIQTGIDGFRLIGERTGKYAPGREPTFEYDQNGRVLSATAYVKKMTPDGTWHEVAAKAYWSEYVKYKYGSTEPEDFWFRMPHGQLAKCAEALALRKAFPADFSGIYSTDEMGQAENTNETINVSSEHVPNIPHVIEQKIVADISKEEVRKYSEQAYPKDPNLFMDFIDDMIKTKSWTYRDCIEKFDRHMDHALKTFGKWCMGKEMEKVGM